MPNADVTHYSLLNSVIRVQRITKDSANKRGKVAAHGNVTNRRTSGIFKILTFLTITTLR